MMKDYKIGDTIDMKCTNFSCKFYGPLVKSKIEKFKTGSSTVESYYKMASGKCPDCGEETYMTVDAEYWGI